MYPVLLLFHLLTPLARLLRFSLRLPDIGLFLPPLHSLGEPALSLVSFFTEVNTIPSWARAMYTQTALSAREVGREFVQRGSEAGKLETRLTMWLSPLHFPEKQLTGKKLGLVSL